MKIISWNVNGIRAIHKKGELFNMITDYNPDILCIQETKADEYQILNIKNEFIDYIQFYESAEKRDTQELLFGLKKIILKIINLVRG
jgi:exodeoxyribonuclease-3